MSVLATYELNERTVAEFSADLVRESGEAIDKNILASLRLTLYDVITKEIINDRHKQNILDDNDVTVSDDGRLTWVLQADDNVMVNSALVKERHRALFEWTWPPGPTAKPGNAQIDIVVRNLFFVPDE